MDAIFCPTCRLRQPVEHTYCARCGCRLPVDLIEPPAKEVRFFAGVKVAPNDPEHAFLRVSCYRKDQTIESPEGSVTIPGHHVRFSIWIDDSARCVVSIPETEARAMASFIARGLDRIDTAELNATT